MTAFNYPLKTNFVYLFGGRCYLLEYLGRGGYENREHSFFLTYPNGCSIIQNYTGGWLLDNIENDFLVVRPSLPQKLLKQIQEYVVNVKHLKRLELPDDLKNMVKIYLGNVAYNKLLVTDSKNKRK
jgi:hypothetical protein